MKYGIKLEIENFQVCNIKEENTQKNENGFGY